MEFLMNNIPLFSIIAPLVLFIIFLLKRLKSPRLNLPPSPPKLPIIGNLHQLGSYPHRFLQKSSTKYGPLMMIHLGSKQALVASSAETAREIMKTHDVVFSNRPKSSTAYKLLYGCRDVAFAPYGDYWRQVRSICVLHLLSSKMVKSFRNVRENETALMVEKIYEKCSSSPSSAVNLSEILKDLTNDIISRVALGRKYGDREDGKRVKETMTVLIELLRDFSLSDYIPWAGWVDYLTGLHARCRKTARDIDVFLEKVIEEHIHGDGGEDQEGDIDFVSVLLQLQRDDTLAGCTVERDMLKAMILDMLVAGTDTTHTLMVWTMSELLRNPDVLKKLQAEIRQVAAGKPEIDEDDLDKLDYLKLVMKESLRLHSPVPLLVPRETTEAVEIKGYHIPAGTQVFVNAWAIGRDPGLWEKPEDFIPERFLENDMDFRGLNNFQLIPFGAGRRGCPGITFSMAVDELALAKLLHRFDFEAQEDLDMTETIGVTVNKKLPLVAVVTPHP